MIPFNSSEISFRCVMLKSISTARGGSLQLVDPVTNTLKRMPIPFAVARSFIHSNFKISNFINPVEAVLVMYGEQVVWIERRVIVESQPVAVWSPKCQTNLEALLPSLGDGSWLFDGRYVYQLTSNYKSIARSGLWMSREARSYDLSSGEDLVISNRMCITYNSPAGSVTTPPIWGTYMEEAVIEKEDGDSVFQFTNFDKVDDRLIVSLMFTIAAGKTVGSLFGYEAVECLQLPQMMLALKTVNLCNLPKEYKALSPAGMQFTHAFSWVMGLMHRNVTTSADLHKLQRLRALMKQLTTTKGAFNKGDALDQVELPPMINVMENLELEKKSRKLI